MNDVCTTCGLNHLEKRLAYEHYKKIMDVPDSRKGTDVDYRNYAVVCCKECRTVLWLEHKVSMLDSVEYLRSIAAEVTDEDVR
jgi:predicted nucleic-acid-binding Zn-ribbon protein